MSVLVIGLPDGSSQMFEETFTVGRGPLNDMILEDDYLSTLHAGFTRDREGWHLQDMGSTNGTYLNGARVYGPELIRRGDRVQIGRTILTLVPA